MSKLLIIKDALHPLGMVKSLMKEFRQETGAFLEIIFHKTQKLNEVLDQEDFELKYENVTVNLELVRNKYNRSTTIKNFILR